MADKVCAAFLGVALVATLGITRQSYASEDAFYDRNTLAMEHHDVAMLELADRLANCAGFYHLAAIAKATSLTVEPGDLEDHFLRLGQDALESVPRPISATPIDEMKLRMLTSLKSLENNFGSLGGTVNVETPEGEAMHQACLALRGSKRSIFGWSAP